MPEQSGTNSDKKPSPVKRFVPSNKKVKTALLVTIGLVIIGVIGFLVYRSLDPKNNPNNIGKVGDHTVTKSEVQDVLNAQKETGLYTESENQIRSLVMNYWLYQLAAKEYGVEVNDQEAVDYLKNQTTNVKPAPKLEINNQYVRYRAYTGLLQYRLTKIISTPRSGAYVLAHFDQNIGGQLTPELKKLSETQYKALLASEKKYATDFINDVSAKLKAGTITFDQAIELEKNDSKIGTKALPTSAHSSVFGKTSESSATQGANDLSKSPQIQDKIKTMKPGDTGDPFVIKVQTGANLDSATVDGIWVIVKLDADDSKGQQFDNLNAALQNIKQKYGYEVYN